MCKLKDKKLEGLTLGQTIKKAKDVGLISNDILTKARRVDTIRNKYVHVDINKIKEIVGYNIYFQSSDWIQEAQTEIEPEPDGLEAYKNLMEILQHLYKI